MKEAILKDKNMVSALGALRLSKAERELVEALLDGAYIIGHREGGLEVFEKWGEALKKGKV